MIYGSCLCRGVKYRVNGPLSNALNFHCSNVPQSSRIGTWRCLVSGTAVRPLEARRDRYEARCVRWLIPNGNNRSRSWRKCIAR